MLQLEVPENFPLTAEQCALLAQCHKETIISNTAKQPESRYYIRARRNTNRGALKIMAKDFLDFLKRTERGYLPSTEKE